MLPSENIVDSKTKWIITCTVMCVAIMEIVDMTVVNVALPNMMASLNADSDQITWILTGYIVSSAVFMLLTGFFSNLLGQKRLLLVAILGFGASSVLCGLSWDLTMMVLARFFQGIFGSFLIPISQSVLLKVFTKEEHGKAMAIWGMGMMAAPILGPTLGGVITEYADWRWIFFVNVPVCCLGFFLAYRIFINKPNKEQAFLDWTGLFFMFIGIMTLQLFLDRGNSKDWFHSYEIIMYAVLSSLSLFFFIGHCLTAKKPIINLYLYRDKNFSIGSIILMLFGASMFSALSISPIMIQNLLHYPVLTTGLISMPMGIASAFGMFFVAGAINKIDARILAGAGLLLSAFGSYLRSRYNLYIGAWDLIFPQIFLGFGMGLFFVPLSTLALSSLPQKDVDEATGLYSFCRNLGSSIGISIVATILSRKTQINWHHLASFVSPYNAKIYNWLSLNHAQLRDPSNLKILANEVYQQGFLLAFIDIYRIIAYAYLIIFPLIFFIKPSLKTEENSNKQR